MPEDRPNSKTPIPPENRVGYAVVGVGKLTAQELLPAYRNSRFSRLAASTSCSVPCTTGTLYSNSRGGRLRF